MIVWHLPAGRTTRYAGPGAGSYASRIDKKRKTHNHTRQLEALGYTLTLTPAA